MALPIDNPPDEASRFLAEMLAHYMGLHSGKPQRREIILDARMAGRKEPTP